MGCLYFQRRHGPNGPQEVTSLLSKHPNLPTESEPQNTQQPDLLDLESLFRTSLITRTRSKNLKDVGFQIFGFLFLERNNVSRTLPNIMGFWYKILKLAVDRFSWLVVSSVNPFQKMYRQAQSHHSQCWDILRMNKLSKRLDLPSGILDQTIPQGI